MSKIRPIAICLIEHGEKLLLQEFWHDLEQYFYFRPPGGGIEFGEHSVEALRREMREELRSEITEPVFVTLIENIFHIGPSPKHEIVFVYKASLTDQALYDREEIWIWDGDPPTRAVWVEKSRIESGEIPLFPLLLRPFFDK